MTRQIVIDNFLVADNKNFSMTKHLVCESSYRLQMVKNKVVDDKVVFLFKRNTALVVDNKRNSFVVDNSFSPVCKSPISEVYFAATYVNVAANFGTMYTCASQASFQAPSKHTAGLSTSKHFPCGNAFKVVG